MFSNLMIKIEDTNEWNISKSVLSEQRSRRTDVSYFDHVKEGVDILKAMNAPLVVLQAFAIHPLFQPDPILAENLYAYGSLFDSTALAICMEYRAVANLGTRENLRNSGWKIKLSILSEVNQMLVADKIQNRKLFEEKLSIHDPAYEELRRYFRCWMEALAISETTYRDMVVMLHS